MMNNNVVHISSPGRINLIGEHTDYNDGFVLPAAIDKRLHLSLRRNGHNSRCTIKSKGFDSVLVLDLQNLDKGTEGWHNYVIGVIAEMQKLGCRLEGFDCEMESYVPVGSGVSSSAALESGLAYGLNELFDLGLAPWELAKLGQRAEHNYVGTQCGIMDQFATIMGKENHAMLLDCQSLEFEYIPADIGPYVFLLLNTNVTHNLSTSGYNTRRQESGSGLELIAQAHNVKPSFRNITEDMVEACKEELGDVRYRRCSYILEENQRVLDATKALKANDLKKLGKLLYDSHEGQSKKYEISCAELDFLVELSKEAPEVLGARMMGGGFGGCTINLIHKDAVGSFVAKASRDYREKFGIELSHFITVPSAGTCKSNQNHEA